MRGEAGHGCTRAWIVCDLARAVIVLGLVWASNLAAVLVLVTLKNIFSTFFNPAEQATIRSTVPHGDLIAANSLNKLSDNGARLLGPGLGGLILAVGGLRGAFVADSASFLLSALILTRLPRIAPAPAIVHEKRQFWPEFRAGVVHIRQRRALVMAVGSMVAGTFLIRATDTIGVVVLKDLGVTAGQLGLSFTCLGIGYVARVRAGTRSAVIHMYDQEGETGDGIVWRGKHRADRTRHAVRLVRCRVGEQRHAALTNGDDRRVVPLAALGLRAGDHGRHAGGGMHPPVAARVT